MRTRSQVFRLIALAIILALLLPGCGMRQGHAGPSPVPATPAPEKPSGTPVPEGKAEQRIPALARLEGDLKVHFIDVGQGDAILIQTPGPTPCVFLIDAGDAAAGPKIVSYLREQGVTAIDWLIATHPHADHIGGMVTVIKAFPVRNVSMPRATHTTKTYEDLLLAIKEKGLLITTARAGQPLLTALNLNALFIAPRDTSYEHLNDFSAVLKISYENTCFLFTGDAEAKSETEMLLASDVSPKADVLKVAHHGGKTSTSAQFLEAVAPKYAVISVGAGNSYGHPSKEVLDRLEKAKVTVFRTDLHGTVVVTSDGKSITVSTSSNSQAETVPSPAVLPMAKKPADPTVYMTKTGSAYHVESCRHLAQSKIGLSLSEAKKRGLSACKVCNPPR